MRSPDLRGFFRPSFDVDMPLRKCWSRFLTNLQLRVILCILVVFFLFVCIPVAKGQDISSGKVSSSAKNSFTGSDFPQRKKRENGTGNSKLYQSRSLSGLLKDDDSPKTASAILSKKKREVINEKTREFYTKNVDLTSKDPTSPEVSKEHDWENLNQGEQLWSQHESSSSNSGSAVDADDYYTYDYGGDGENNAEGKTDLPVDRSKKDTSSTRTGGKSHSLDRLAELVTGANPQLGLVNLGTPNPDIEITIEVLNGDELQTDGVVVSMDLRDEAVGTAKAPEQREKPSTPNRDRQDQDNLLPVSTTKTDEEADAGDKESYWSVSEDEEDSYSSVMFAPLRRLPDPNGEDFQTDGTDDKTGPGAWSDWSACSASCGGGRSERSRSCGFSCTATESRDCNRQSCPRRDESEGRNEGLTEGAPQLPALDREYLGTVLDPQNFDTDSCEEWMECRSETLLSYLSRLQDLPNCPCFYPSNLHRNNAIWDRQKRHMFRWLDASGAEARLDVYKPTAVSCITSMLSPQSTSLAAQQCCYDDNLRLITRGPGAGTPFLISPEISRELHYKIDIMPWIICKGDWTKYNKVRHPNNMRECKDTPDQAQFYRLIQEAKNF